MLRLASSFCFFYRDPMTFIVTVVGNGYAQMTVSDVSGVVQFDSGTTTYYDGSLTGPLRFEAFPAEDHSLLLWNFLDTPPGPSTDNPYIIPSLSSPSDIILVVVFTWTLTIDVSGSGVVSSVTAPPATEINIVGPGTQTVEYDATVLFDVTLTASPAPGWFFGGWTGDGTGTSNIRTVSIAADNTIHALFLPFTSYGVGSSAVYVPSTQERTDTLKLLCCPCRESTQLPETYDERTRRARALLTRGCCPYWTITYTITVGSNNFADKDILQLVGGTPVDKPLLLRVDGSALRVLYPAKYRVRPVSDMFVNLTNFSRNTGTDSIVLDWYEVCP